MWATASGASRLGAGPDQVLVCDSTTVNLYKLAVAALRARDGRRAVVADRGEFPTDRYVLDALAEARGLELRWIDADPVEGLDPASVAAALDDDVALLCLSHVAYRSGAVADLAGLTARAHDAGALTLWDLSHSAGALPLALDRDGVDLAVGCTYKHLNAGPGAPAFLYVRRDLRERLRQPIPGWMGHADVFAMGPAYEPAPGARRFAAGTPPILGLVLVDEGVALVEEAGIEGLRARSVALTEAAVTQFDARLAPLGWRLASPRDPGAPRRAHRPGPGRRRGRARSAGRGGRRGRLPPARRPASRPGPAVHHPRRGLGRPRAPAAAQLAARARRWLIQPQTSSSRTAPMMAPTQVLTSQNSSIGSPKPNSRARPPAISAPAMPIRHVTMIPPGCLPGRMSLASPPAIRPIAIQPMIPMPPTSPVLGDAAAGAARTADGRPVAPGATPVWSRARRRPRRPRRAWWRR